MAALGNWTQMTWSSGTTGALTLTKTALYPSFNELLVGLGFCAATNTNVSLQVNYDLVDTTLGSYESGIGSFNPSTNVLTRSSISKSVTTSGGVATVVTKGATAITAASTTSIFLGTTVESQPGMTIAGTGYLGTQLSSPNTGIFPLNWIPDSSTSTATANTERYMLFYWNGTQAIDQFSFKLGAGTAGNMRFYIYECGYNGEPGGLLWDSGSLSPTASAINNVATSAGAPTALTLPPGWYWMACNFSNSTLTYQRIIAGIIPTPLGQNGGNAGLWGFTTALAYGAPAATGHAVSSSVISNVQAANAAIAFPCFSLRMAA